MKKEEAVPQFTPGQEKEMQGLLGVDWKAKLPDFLNFLLKILSSRLTPAGLVAPAAPTEAPHGLFTDVNWWEAIPKVLRWIADRFDDKLGGVFQAPKNG